MRLPSRGAALAAALAVGTLSAQDAATVRREVRAYREAREPQIVREFADLLAIPNVASDAPNIRRNAEHIKVMLERRGLAAQILENGVHPPAVFAELRTPGATRTVVFYAHYDGQPVTPAEWTTPPWQVTLRDKALFAGGKPMVIPTSGRIDPEARLYARGASDDKAPIVAMLTALDALRAAGRAPSVNLKFFFEGEEEAGSENLRPLLARYASLLTADAWIICDGPVHQSRKQQVTFGVRGVVGFEATVYGPTRPLHDGHYGNWAPNPAVLIADLVRALRDPDGGPASATVIHRLMLDGVSLPADPRVLDAGCG
ncbi:MAG: M20/M25/M40 family metallo-hydrolase, partial [Gemmatimonadaceae bacterium]|nr:M20/M25/M40 family metallo-hydrolase [Gemmatimonadaceae bacterium]